MEKLMQMITDVKIDLYGEVQYYMVSAKQGDKATRYIRVQLMNNGNEFQIPDSVRMIANIKKPDGKFCYNECVKADNRVMVQLTNQALAAAGTAYCDIEMRSSDGELILSSAAFTIEIEPSMRNEDAIESSNEMTYLDSKIQEHIDHMLETKQKLEEAFELIKKGAFPGTIFLEAGEDVNQYDTDGIYYFLSPVNGPNGGNGWCMVFRFRNNTYAKQIWFCESNTGKIRQVDTYTRTKVAGVWHPWEKYLMKGDPEGRMLSGYLDPANVTAPCWLRVARFHDESPSDSNTDILGAAPYSCLISIKRSYNYMNTEEYLIRLDSKYQHARLSQMYGYGDSQLITDVRLVADTAAHELYLDIYYNYSNPNPILVSFLDANVHGGWWEALPFLVVAGSKADWTVLSNLKPKREFFLDLNILDSGNNSVLTFAYSKPGLGASEFPNGWLAAWNDRELRAIHWSTLKTIMGLNNVNNTADAVKNVNSAVMLKGWSDTRNTANVPNDYNGSFRVMGIKNKAGLVGDGEAPDNSAYFTTMGIRGHNDSTGGFAHELIFSGGATEIYHRAGLSTSWNSIRRIAHIDNIPTALSSFINDLTKVKLVPDAGSWVQGMQVNRAGLAIRDKATTDSYYPAMTMQLKEGHVGSIGMCSNNFGLWGYLAGRTANGTDAAFYFDFGQKMWCIGPALKGDVKGNADTATDADKLDGYHASAFEQQFQYSTRNSLSGWYKIKIKSTSSWMVSFVINLYQNYEVTMLLISGYNYGSNYWHSPKARIIDSSLDSMNVKFGYDAVGSLWVAVPASNYTGITITNISNGYTKVEDWANNFTIENMATLTGTVQQTITAYRPLKKNENAVSATTAATATKLDSNAGSATQPVYFSGGKPAACSYSLGKSVPSDAVFTDTNTWRPVQNNLTSTSTSDALSAAQGRALANGSARDSTKLPLAGGTMTGALNMNGQQVNLASDAYIFAGANVFIGSSRANAVVQTRSAGGLAVLNATGAAYVHVLASAFTVSSSRKVKEHIREMTRERARKVLEYQVVTFDYIGDDTPNDCDGMIAEDIDEIYEYPVSRDCQGEIIGLDYSKFVPQLIKMIQLQEERIDGLTAIVEKQGKEIEALKEHL